MSCIRSEFGGWVQLTPATVNQVWELCSYDEKKKDYIIDKAHGTLMYMGTRPSLPTPAQERGSYVGKIPSQDIVTFFNRTQERMKFFDDGTRMAYGRPDRIVEVDNLPPTHPIAYPPSQFKLVDGQFVLKRSKYE